MHWSWLNTTEFKKILRTFHNALERKYFSENPVSIFLVAESVRALATRSQTDKVYIIAYAPDLKVFFIII